jgi:hypothetical protein
MRRPILFLLLVLPSLVLTLLIAFVVLTWEKRDSNNDASLKEDLRRLQGKWEYTFKEGEVNAGIRKVHEIEGTKDTVTWYLMDGRIFAVNVGDFKLDWRRPWFTTSWERAERVFVWSNGKVTEGQYKGAPFADGWCVYKLEGDEWTEYLPDGLGKVVWKRVKENE